MLHKKVILLMGPTASGKTALALKLANKYPVELINVDSALVYKNMDIGTAKPSNKELELVPHHLIDIITPLESYSVAQFINNVTLLIKNIIFRGKIPLLVGGTMMYFNALLKGLSALPQSNLTIRHKLEERINAEGLGSLFSELIQIDHNAASRININDRQRIIRALEVFYITGVPISILQQHGKSLISKDFHFLSLAFVPNDRQVLHNRINSRFDKMIKDGFIDEVSNLRALYPELAITHTSMRCVGYRQIWEYLDRRLSLNELYDMGKAATRQLAKRQLTWIKAMKVENILLSDTLNIDSIFDMVERQIEQNG